MITVPFDLARNSTSVVFDVDRQSSAASFSITRSVVQTLTPGCSALKVKKITCAAVQQLVPTLDLDVTRLGVGEVVQSLAPARAQATTLGGSGVTVPITRAVVQTLQPAVQLDVTRLGVGEVVQSLAPAAASSTQSSSGTLFSLTRAVVQTLAPNLIKQAQLIRSVVQTLAPARTLRTPQTFTLTRSVVQTLAPVLRLATITAEQAGSGGSSGPNSMPGGLGRLMDPK